MTPETPFFIASVTKMFTAAIVMGLHEESRLDLDAPIAKYLPASVTRGVHVYRGTDYGDRIKVYQLVNQTSGIADYETDRARGAKSIMQELMSGRDRAITTEQAVEITRTLAPRFAPGTRGRAHYSNTNYRLLGAIIETITEQPMASCFQQRICTRLGLQHTYLYDWATRGQGPAPATIYCKDAPTVIPKYLSSNVSDGGLVSNVRECLVFLRAFFEGRLFTMHTLERMMQWNSIFFPLRYGHGLMYFRLPRFFWLAPLPEFIGHSGSTGSFAFTCPTKSIDLVGTLNIVAPAKPFFFMMNLVRSIEGR